MFAPQKTSSSSSALYIFPLCLRASLASVFAKSFPCRTYKIFSRNFFSCRTYKNKGLITPLFAAHTKNRGVSPETVNYGRHIGIGSRCLRALCDLFAFRTVSFRRSRLPRYNSLSDGVSL